MRGRRNIFYPTGTALFQGLGSVREAFWRTSPHGGACAGASSGNGVLVSSPPARRSVRGSSCPAWLGMLLGTLASRRGALGNANAGETPAYPGAGVLASGVPARKTPPRTRLCRSPAGLREGREYRRRGAAAGGSRRSSGWAGRPRRTPSARREVGTGNRGSGRRRIGGPWPAFWRLPRWPPPGAGAGACPLVRGRAGRGAPRGAPSSSSPRRPPLHRAARSWRGPRRRTRTRAGSPTRAARTRRAGAR